MAKILIGGVVGGLVVFFWGFVSHEFLPLGVMGLQSMRSEEGMAAAMKNDFIEAGLYMVPGMDMSKAQSKEEMEVHAAKIAKGPYGFMVVYPNGRDASIAKRLPIEFGTNVVCALLAAILVTQIRPGFFVRVACVTLVGVLAGVMTSVPFWNWYGFPADFTVAQIIIHSAGWLLAGIALAAIVRPSKAKPVEQTAAA